MGEEEEGREAAFQCLSEGGASPSHHPAGVPMIRTPKPSHARVVCSHVARGTKPCMHDPQAVRRAQPRSHRDFPSVRGDFVNISGHCEEIARRLPVWRLLLAASQTRVVMAGTDVGPASVASQSDSAQRDGVAPQIDRSARLSRLQLARCRGRQRGPSTGTGPTSRETRATASTTPALCRRGSGAC